MAHKTILARTLQIIMLTGIMLIGMMSCEGGDQLVQERDIPTPYPTAIVYPYSPQAQPECNCTCACDNSDTPDPTPAPRPTATPQESEKIP